MGDGSGRARFAAGLALATGAPLVLAPLTAPPTGTGPGEVLGALVVVAYAGHLAVTGWLWTTPDVRAMARSRPGRLAALPATLVAASAALAVVVPGRTLERLLLLFFAWQFAHFQRQNLGLVELVGAKWGAPKLSRSERRLGVCAGWCATASLLARPQLLGLSVVVPPSVRAVAVHLAGVGFAACVVGSVRAARRAARPAPVAVAHVAAVAFMTPVFLFRSAAAAVTGIVIAHGLQYLWVVGARSAGPGHREPGAGRRALVRVASIAVAGGAALEAMAELHGSGAAGLRLLYGAYLGAVLAHVAVDSAVWRSPAPRASPSPSVRPLVPSAAQGRR